MRLVIFVVALVLGAVLMSFEMIASRYLTPYFGSGINTWAALIAVVLLALAAGYFIGGYLVDRYPSLRVAAIFASIAAVWFFSVPFFVDGLLNGVMMNIESEVVGVLIGAALLQLVPLTAIGTYSPIALRLLLSDVRSSGKTSGAIYGVSTFGNIIGTLGTPLLIIPSIGSKDATFGLATITLACALLLWVSARRPATA